MLLSTINRTRRKIKIGSNFTLSLILSYIGIKFGPGLYIPNFIVWNTLLGNSFSLKFPTWPNNYLVSSTSCTQGKTHFLYPLKTEKTTWTDLPNGPWVKEVRVTSRPKHLMVALLPFLSLPLPQYLWGSVHTVMAKTESPRHSREVRYLEKMLRLSSECVWLKHRNVGAYSFSSLSSLSRLTCRMTKMCIIADDSRKVALAICSGTGYHKTVFLSLYSLHH